MIGTEQRGVDSLSNVLEVDRLSIRFGTTEVVTDLSFRVPEGSSLAIIGPNGAGKTVLVRALLGLLPCRGVIRWAPGSRIGYVPQKLDLDRDIPITGRDFLQARAALAKESSANIAHAIELVGLAPKVADQPIGTMSGGQFQRLLVAFALVGKPTVLLLDEPTAGVDEPGQEQFNQLMHRLQKDQRLTVLFISHDLSVVYRYADAVLCLSRKLACIGPPNDILTPERLQEIYGMPLRYHVHDW